MRRFSSSLTCIYRSLFVLTTIICSTCSYAEEDNAVSACIDSFNETRERVLSNSTQSVIVLSNTNGIAPFITLQKKNGDSHYALWQSLNGDIRGYALRDGKGFDYTTNITTATPLAWHPTFIWDNLFATKKPLKNYACVLTGRTRVMGKKVSLLRLVPQEGLRFAFLLAKEDETDFPVELSVVDNKGVVVARLTTMDSRIVVGSDFPISDELFDRILHEFNQSREEDKDIERDTTKLSQAIWKELTIPDAFEIVSAGRFKAAGPECVFQEFSDGITSFRVYRNKRSTVFYPVLNNGSISVVRRNSLNYEYSVVGEVPVPLAEFVLARISDK